MTDGDQSVPPIFPTGGRFEVVATLGVNAVDNPSHVASASVCRPATLPVHPLITGRFSPRQRCARIEGAAARTKHLRCKQFEFRTSYLPSNLPANRVPDNEFGASVFESV